MTMPIECKSVFLIFYHESLRYIFLSTSKQWYTTIITLFRTRVLSSLHTNHKQIISITQASSAIANSNLPNEIEKPCISLGFFFLIYFTLTEYFRRYYVCKYRLEEMGGPFTHYLARRESSQHLIDFIWSCDICFVLLGRRSSTHYTNGQSIKLKIRMTTQILYY